MVEVCGVVGVCGSCARCGILARGVCAGEGERGVGRCGVEVEGKKVLRGYVPGREWGEG